MLKMLWDVCAVIGIISMGVFFSALVVGFAMDKKRDKLYGGVRMDKDGEYATRKP